MERRQKLILTGLAGLSGLLLALAYPGWSASWRIDLGFLVWIGFIPLIAALKKSVALNHDRDGMQRFAFPWRAFVVGTIAGLVYFLIIFRWFWSIYPLDTLGIQSKALSFIVVLLIYLVSAAGMAVSWGMFGMAYGYWLRLRGPTENSRWFKIIAILAPAAFFVLLEYARSYGFGLLWAGSGTLFGPHWTLGNLAYSLAGSDAIRWLASYAGIYGITFFIIMINSALAMVLSMRPHRKYHGIRGMVGTHGAVAALVGTVILLFHIWPIAQTPLASQKTITYALIQTNQPTKLALSPQETLAGFKKQLELLNRVAQEHPESQLIIFPEASDFFKNLSLFLTGAQIPNYFSNLFKEPRLIVAGARIIDTDGRAYSRVFALDTQKDIIGFYDKQLLTPEGEFLSYPTKFIVNLLSKTKVSEFSGIRELGVGKKKASTVNFRGQFSVAPIVCSELLSPGLVREATRGSDIIVEMASYGVFHGSTVLARQNLASARFRAAENQKPLIMAANMSLSYAINGNGNITKITPNQAPQILTGSIALNPQKSWYNKVGDLPTILASLVLVVVFSLQLIVHNRRNKVF